MSNSRLRSSSDNQVLRTTVLAADNQVPWTTMLPLQREFWTKISLATSNQVQRTTVLPSRCSPLAYLDVRPGPGDQWEGRHFANY